MGTCGSDVDSKTRPLARSVYAAVNRPAVWRRDSFGGFGTTRGRPCGPATVGPTPGPHGSRRANRQQNTKRLRKPAQIRSRYVNAWVNLPPYRKGWTL